MVKDSAAVAETQSSQMEKSRKFDAVTLREIDSFDAALAALTNAGIVARDAADELGDGFELLDDKDKGQLVGVPLMILDAVESEGDYGRSFVTVRLITRDGRKVIITDGSTGIRDQLVTSTGGVSGAAGLQFLHGLRASNYRFCESCKGISKENATSCIHCGHSPLSPAATYYFDTSK